MRPDKTNLTIVYYTSNYLEDKNPYFLSNTKKQLLEAAGDLPIVSVSQKPISLGTNICVGDIGRSHLNIYRQILIGAKEAKTEFVAMAEDDILYSFEHFHHQLPLPDRYLYDMNRISLFTWTKPPIFSYRHNRTVVNQLIAPRQMLIDNLEERFKVFPEFAKTHGGEEHALKYFADPGRYEDILGITPRRIDKFMCTKSSIVFSHEWAYGYEFNQGKKKRLGDLRIIETQGWPRAEEVLRLFYESSN